jgi:hypothetical protein
VRCAFFNQNFSESLFDEAVRRGVIGRPMGYHQAMQERFAAELAAHGMPGEEAGAIAAQIAEVPDASQRVAGDSVQRALGRPPRDFRDCARCAAARGAWSSA